MISRIAYRLPKSLQALVLIGATSVSLSFLAGCHQKPEVAADQPVPVRLRTPNQLREPVSVSASGSVEANVTALTAFQIGGRVAKVFVDEGQFVKQGQILAELDPSDYKNAYDAAAGQAASAAASALQAKNGPRPQELDEARIDFERAQDEYQRMKYLYDHQSLSANDFQKFQAAFLVSQQRYDMARQGSRERREAGNWGSGRSSRRADERSK